MNRIAALLLCWALYSVSIVAVDKLPEPPEPELPVCVEHIPEVSPTVLGVVAQEAADEPYEGQMAVAQCIAETAKRKGISLRAVVEAPGQYAAPRTDAASLEKVRPACEAVLIHGERVTDEPIEYFYAPDLCRSDWHEEDLTFVMEIGGHRFFRR